MFERESRFAACEMRAADNGVVTALAAPYNVWTPIGGAYLERFVEDTFARSIRERPLQIPFMSKHDHGEWPIGKPLEWKHTEAGLIGKWQLDSSDRAVEVGRMIREGVVTGVSTGFAPDAEADEVEVSEAGVTRVTRHNARLFEVSAVPIPAVAEAQILMVRSAGVPQVVKDAAAEADADKPTSAVQAALENYRADRERFAKFLD